MGTKCSLTFLSPIRTVFIFYKEGIRDNELHQSTKWADNIQNLLRSWFDSFQQIDHPMIDN